LEVKRRRKIIWLSGRIWQGPRRKELMGHEKHPPIWYLSGKK